MISCLMHGAFKSANGQRLFSGYMLLQNRYCRHVYIFWHLIGILSNPERINGPEN